MDTAAIAVAATAARWGFTNLDTFTVAYVGMFGETPTRVHRRH